MDTQRTATLTINGTGNSVDLPIYSGTLVPDVIDVRGLSKLGIFTYDPGFLSTAACRSDITFIDGDVGHLYYRGYPIEQLAEKSDFVEVCYLLLNGELPNATQLKEFDATSTRHALVNEQRTRFYQG